MKSVIKQDKQCNLQQHMKCLRVFKGLQENTPPSLTAQRGQCTARCNIIYNFLKRYNDLIFSHGVWTLYARGRTREGPNNLLLTLEANVFSFGSFDR